MTALATDSGRKTPARLASSAILACQSDDRLVKLVRSGHERAFEAIVDRYRKPLMRFCSRFLPESRCEDAVQQAFINAHAALNASDEPIQLKAWIYAITRNAALNMVRQNGWNYDQIPLDFDGVRRPDQVVEQRIELQRTVAAVGALPERQRDALVMREFEGRSYSEIAVALGANHGAVRQLLNRARVTLRDAASALIPPPLVARAASSLPPSDGRRMSEVLGGLGAAGMAKAGATALVAGSLVVGAVNAPLPIGDSPKTTLEQATLAVDGPGRATAAAQSADAHDATVSLRANAPATSGNPKAHKSPGADKRHRSSNPGPSHSGPSHSGENEHSGSGERHRSGSDGMREHSSTRGDDDSTSHSGSDDATTEQSSDHSGTSGSGSDDGAATLVESGDVSGTSGTSGSDDSTSSSGTSGTDSSGSDDTTTTSSSSSSAALDP